jgi:hypothetical protein
VAGVLVALGVVTGRVEAQADSAPVLRRIEIHRQEVFDSAEARRNWLARAANAVHVQTKRHTIERELLFRTGQPWDTLLAFETIQNLRSTGIFRQVRLDTVRTDSGFVARVTARDAWTTRADARFRSTGDQADWQVSFFEDNLFGKGTRIGARYRKTPDRSYTTFQLAQRRLIANLIGVDLRYETRSDGERQRVIVNQPFFSTRSGSSGSSRARMRRPTRCGASTGWAGRTPRWPSGPTRRATSGSGSPPWSGVTTTPPSRPVPTGTTSSGRADPLRSGGGPISRRHGGSWAWGATRSRWT